MSPNAKKQLTAVVAMLVAGAALAYISLGDIGETLGYSRAGICRNRREARRNPDCRIAF